MLSVSIPVLFDSMPRRKKKIAILFFVVKTCRQQNKSSFESFFRKLYHVLAKGVLSEDMIGTKKKLVNPTEDGSTKFIKLWPKWNYIGSNDQNFN